MSAAVATRQSQGHSGRINSPLDTKRHFDEPKRGSPVVTARDLAKNSPKTATKQNPARSTTAAAKAKAAAATTATTATTATEESSPQQGRAPSLPPPPPPPPPAAVEENGGDYFSGVHSNKYGEEPNPFEQSFSANDGGLTPGKVLLPPASQIASPSPNLATGSTFWGFNSLRSGPLSPAMLTGPSGASFDASLRTGLTPNESGIRSGLTPGGSGSMFPAPSPNTQALFGFGSGATPGTLEFQKTAMAAQAVNRAAKPIMAQPIPVVSKAEDNGTTIDINTLKMGQQPPRPPSDPFGIDANAAASGLYMLAQQGSQHQQNEAQFVTANLPQGIPVPQPTAVVPMNIDAASATMKRGSIATSGHSRNASSTTRGISEGSEDAQFSDSVDGNPTVKGKKGKAAAKKSAAAAAAAAAAPKPNNRRKAEEPKGAAKKKRKASIGSSFGDDDEDMDDMDDTEMGGTEDDGGDKSSPVDTKKMTDEEKRKNFLERNRVAALKCRQRKKQWLANLQAKVEYYGSENDALTSQVTNLREEILTLKTLLLAHKDCPISRAAGAQGMTGLEALGALGQGDYGQVHHGFAVPQISMAPPGPRRFS